MHVPLDYGLSYTAQDETVENQQVWAALGLMQQRYQTMLIHAHVYDYPRRTIAENLGVSLRTVEKYMQVAKKQFRENMSA